MTLGFKTETMVSRLQDNPGPVAYLGVPLGHDPFGKIF